MSEITVKIYSVMNMTSPTGKVKEITDFFPTKLVPEDITRDIMRSDNPMEGYLSYIKNDPLHWLEFNEWLKDCKEWGADVYIFPGRV